MKQVSAFAFKRPASAWLLITSDELARLDGLEAWAFKLFMLLVKFSDFKTGQGRTGYGELITSLSPDQPAAGRRLWVPTRDDVKAYLRRFAELGLVSLDTVASEKGKAVFFQVLPRTRTGTPAKKLPPDKTPTPVEVKQAELTPRIVPGDSENKRTKNACETAVDNSAFERAKPGLKAVRDAAARGGPARGKKRAPEGA